MTEKLYNYDEIYKKVHNSFINYYRGNGDEMSLSERLLFEDIQNFIQTSIEMNFSNNIDE